MAKGKAGRILVFSLVAAVLAGAGGVAGAQYFRAGGEETAKPRPPVFVAMEPLVANLRVDYGQQYVQVVASLKVENAQDAARVSEHMPALRHGMLVMLSGKSAQDIDSTEEKQALREEMTRIANAAAGGGKAVEETLLQSFVVQ